MGDDKGFLSVHIDFATSHLFFPNIIHWVLAILGISILIVHRREIVGTLRGWAETWKARNIDFDKLRLFGTLAIIIVYFAAMEPVGELYPNTGFGFLIMSIPFMFSLSLLYVHDPNPKKLLIMGANAVIVPLVAWYVLAELFFITLP